jgi:hypothetical protein
MPVDAEEDKPSDTVAADSSEASEQSKEPDKDEEEVCQIREGYIADDEEEEEKSPDEEDEKRRKYKRRKQGIIIGKVNAVGFY